MKKVLYITILVLTCLSCTKEIDMDFDSIQPKIVIQGTLNESSSQVYISLSNNVNDSVFQNIDNAKVSITNSAGDSIFLDGNNGIYVGKGFDDVKNTNYNIKVDVDGNIYSANSNMLDYVPVDSIYFRWFEVYSDLKILFCSFVFADNPLTSDYYYYTIYRNGDVYSWDVIKDDIAVKNLMVADVSCMTSKTAEDDPDSDFRIYEGDTLNVVLRHVDRQCYDYLESVKVAKNNYSNPNDYFTNDALGFFVACRPSYSSDLIYK